MDSEPNTASDTATAVELGSFFSHLLTPGSSLNPTFLLVLDGAFAILLLVFISLLVITRSIHLVFLVVIETCLWVTVKWFVSELQNVHTQETAIKEENGAPTSGGSKAKAD